MHTTPHEFDECLVRCLSDANTHKIADIVCYHQGGPKGDDMLICVLPFFSYNIPPLFVKQTHLKSLGATVSFQWREFLMALPFSLFFFLRFRHQKSSSFQKHQPKTNNRKRMVFISVKIVLQNEKGFRASSGMIKETLEHNKGIVRFF